VLCQNGTALNRNGREEWCVPDDIVTMCKSIELTPQVSGEQYKNADVERFLSYPDGVESKIAKNKFQNMKMKQEVDEADLVTEENLVEDNVVGEEDKEGEGEENKNEDLYIHQAVVS